MGSIFAAFLADPESAGRAAHDAPVLSTPGGQPMLQRQRRGRPGRQRQVTRYDGRAHLSRRPRRCASRRKSSGLYIRRGKRAQRRKSAEQVWAFHLKNRLRLAQAAQTMRSGAAQAQTGGPGRPRAPRAGSDHRAPRSRIRHGVHDQADVADSVSVGRPLWIPTRTTDSLRSRRARRASPQRPLRSPRRPRAPPLRERTRQRTRPRVRRPRGRRPDGALRMTARTSASNAA